MMRGVELRSIKHCLGAFCQTMTIASPCSLQSQMSSATLALRPKASNLHLKNFALTSRCVNWKRSKRNGHPLLQTEIELYCRLPELRFERLMVSIIFISLVTIELYKRAIDRAGSGEHHWRPRSPDAAGNSISYLASVALSDGGVTRRSFDHAHLGNSELATLIGKVRLVENENFTRAYGKTPVEHRTRITVATEDGAIHVAESGADEDDLSAEKSDQQIEAKFRSLTERVLARRRVSNLLDRLWHLETLSEAGPLAVELDLAKR